MNKVVLVSQSFPPVGGSHATRTYALLSILSDKYQVMGVTIDVGKNYPNKNTENEEKIKVIRVFPGLFHYFAHGFDRGSVNHDDKNYNKKGDKISSIKASLIGIYRKIEFIDSYFDWIPHLGFHLRKNLSQNDILVSMSMPNSSHVGALIALIGKRNKWIADFADPWTLDKSALRNKGKFKKKIEKLIEHQIIRRADAIFFCTEVTLFDYKREYPRYAQKMELARMGHESMSHMSITDKDFLKRSFFYGGTLPSENRDATNLFKSIETFKDIKFVFAGPSVDNVIEYFSEGIPSNVEIIHWLSHEEYIKMLKLSEVSIIFGNSNPQQIPGKVLQCMGSANKILYILNMEYDKDEAVKILENLPYVTISSNSVNEIERSIRDVVSSDKFNSFDEDSFEWKNVLQPIIERIEKML